MNSRVVIALFIFFCKTSYSQNIEWNTYDFDSIVSVEMPFTVYELDTIQDNRKMYQIFSNNESIEFRVQKLYLGKLYSNVETITLPHDDDSLEKLYSEMIWAITKVSQYNLKYSKSINESNLKGYKLVFNDSEGSPIHELNLFVVNKSLYTFSYLNTNDFNEIERNLFFDSIAFNDEKELRQYPKKPFLTGKKIILALFLFLLLSFLMRFKSKRKSN
ncbi:MAG: hypothetical protein JXR05_03630 [Flavobacteriaceae bacterium]